MEDNFTINEFVEELSSFHRFSKLQMTKAKSSRITTKNNSQFRQVVKNYCNGLYDGDLDVLVQRMIDFVNE